MKICSFPYDMPDIMDIWDKSCSVSFEHYQVIRMAHKVFLSDSGDSYCSFYYMQNGKYHMHVASASRNNRDLYQLLIEAIEYMILQDDAEVIVGFVRHRGLQLMIAHRSKGCIRTQCLPDNERLYIITKEDLEEIKKCLMVESE